MEERMELISYREIDAKKKASIYELVKQIRKDAEGYWPTADTLDMVYTCAKDPRIGEVLTVEIKEAVHANSVLGIKYQYDMIDEPHLQEVAVVEYQKPLPTEDVAKMFLEALDLPSKYDKDIWLKANNPKPYVVVNTQTAGMADVKTIYQEAVELKNVMSKY